MSSMHDCLSCFINYQSHYYCDHHSTNHLLQYCTCSSLFSNTKYCVQYPHMCHIDWIDTCLYLQLFQGTAAQGNEAFITELQKDEDLQYLGFVSSNLPKLLWIAVVEFHRKYINVTFNLYSNGTLFELYRNGIRI